MSEKQQQPYQGQYQYGGGQQNAYSNAFQPPPYNPGMQQQQGYAPAPQQSPPMKPQNTFQQGPWVGTSSDALNGGNHPQNPNSYSEGKFEKSGYRDLWAAVLFIAHFIAFVGLAVVSINEIKTNGIVNKNGNNNPQNNSDWPTETKLQLLFSLLTVTAVAGVMGGGWLLMMQSFAKTLIIVTFWMSAALNVAFALYLIIVLKSYIFGIILLVFALLYVMMWFSWRRRIPLATLILETVTKVTRMYWGTIITSFAALVIHLAYTVFWSVTIIGAQQYFYNNNNAKTAVIVFLVFSYYYTSQVLMTVNHVTVCGTVASYMFLYGSPSMPSKPTPSALKRALTTSFGPICFGSLIIAVIQTIKFLIRTAANNHSDNAAAQFLAACAVCLLNIIDDLAQYFNHYAYVYVAMYGRSYIQSAKDTWTMIKHRGIDAIINDNLIGNVLAMGAIFVGLVVAFVGYIYGVLTPPIHNFNIEFIPAIAGFFIGFLATTVINSTVNSGVATVFVTLGESGLALRERMPELYQQLLTTYPTVNPA